MQIKITNPDKLIFPKQKIKKVDVINYYIDISKLMLPFVKNRPLSVIRCHDGIKGECFFKKHPASDKFIHTFFDDEEEYFYIKTQQELAYQSQLGTLEFHTWGSKLPKLENPDIMIFDLDPDKDLPLSKLRDRVLKVKSVLDELNLQSFLKTSGGKGYHIVLPFKSSRDWDSFYDFSKNVAIYIENKWPKDFTTNIRKSERKGRIFVDYLRNNRSSTCAALYSIRARDGAPISFPISWNNLDKIKPNEITIKNYEKYLNNSWGNFFKINQKLK